MNFISSYLGGVGVIIINFVYIFLIFLGLFGEGGWEYLILFVTTRPNEKQRQSCKYFFLVD